MRQNTMMGRAALLIFCAGLTACSSFNAPGSTEKTLNEQAAWASNLAVERNRPQATAASAGPGGTVRLVAGELTAAPPPPVIAQVAPAPVPAAASAPVNAAPAIPAPAAAAAPVAASAAKAAPDERRVVLAEILAWRKAWVEGNATAYISHYDSNFTGDLADRKSWEKQRRERLANRDIAVRIENLTATVSDGMAETEFEQRYTSKKHEDVGIKSMKLRKVNGRWLIVEEKWRKG